MKSQIKILATENMSLKEKLDQLAPESVSGSRIHTDGKERVKRKVLKIKTTQEIKKKASEKFGMSDSQVIME